MADHNTSFPSRCRFHLSTLQKHIGASKAMLWTTENMRSKSTSSIHAREASLSPQTSTDSSQVLKRQKHISQDSRARYVADARPSIGRGVKIVTTSGLLGYAPDREAMRPYTYRPLRTENSCRVLILFSALLESSPLTAKLHHIELDSWDEADDYDALSYAWGTPTLTSRLYCEGATIPIYPKS